LKKIMKEIFFNNIGLTCNFAELINHETQARRGGQVAKEADYGFECR
jgi:hypothetical protein